MTLSTCFLKQPTSICPGVVPPIVSWTLSHQSLIKNMPRDLPLANLMEAFSLLKFLLPRRPCLMSRWWHRSFHLWRHLTLVLLYYLSRVPVLTNLTNPISPAFIFCISNTRLNLLKMVANSGTHLFLAFPSLLQLPRICSLPIPSQCHFLSYSFLRT